MITRHHLVLALLWSLIVSIPYLLTAPIMVFIFCAGACAGSILPDVHMSRPKRLLPRSFAWAIAQVPRRIITPAVCRIYRYAGYPGLEVSDKRVTHSLPGLLALAVGTGVIFLVPAVFAGDNILLFALFFVSGMWAGLLFHLVQDLCTRKGIYPFFPFSGAVIHGSIRPCDRDDHRIFWFHIEGCVSVFILVLVVPGIASPEFSLLASATALVVCIGTMISVSGVSVRRGIRENHDPESGHSLNYRVSLKE